jgi:hypothetical protein
MNVECSRIVGQAGESGMVRIRQILGGVGPVSLAEAGKDRHRFGWRILSWTIAFRAVVGVGWRDLGRQTGGREERVRSLSLSLSLSLSRDRARARTHTRSQRGPISQKRITRFNSTSSPYNINMKRRLAFTRAVRLAAPRLCGKERHLLGWGLRAGEQTGLRGRALKSRRRCCARGSESRTFSRGTGTED